MPRAARVDRYDGSPGRSGAARVRCTTAVDPKTRRPRETGSVAEMARAMSVDPAALSAALSDGTAARDRYGHYHRFEWIREST